MIKKQVGIYIQSEIPVQSHSADFQIQPHSVTHSRSKY